MNIKDILIITSDEYLSKFKEILGDGTKYGIKLSYAVQKVARGIADAFIIAKDFIGKDNVCLMLGDNIIYGKGFDKFVSNFKGDKELENTDSIIFGYKVDNPRAFGVAQVDKDNRVISIEEKPKEPKSNIAVIGLYIYNNLVVNYAKDLKPSARGELEITDINNLYIKNNRISLQLLEDTYWFDTGNPDSLLDTSLAVREYKRKNQL